MSVRPSTSKSANTKVLRSVVSGSLSFSHDPLPLGAYDQLPPARLKMSVAPSPLKSPSRTSRYRVFFRMSQLSRALREMYQYVPSVRSRR